MGYPLEIKDEMEMISDMCPGGYGRRTAASTGPRFEQVVPGMQCQVFLSPYRMNSPMRL